MDIRHIIWIYMDIYEHTCNIWIIYGHLWTSMDIDMGNSWFAWKMMYIYI